MSDALETGGINEYEAAAKIAALSNPPVEKPRDETGRFAKPKENPEVNLPTEQPSDDVEAPDEAAPTDEDIEIDLGDEETEQTNAPSLDMPTSWGKTAEAIWQTLPPEAQQFLSQHETKRSQGISRQLNELKSEQEKVSQAQAQVEQERLQIAQHAQRFQSETFRRHQEQFADITDMSAAIKLSQENPARYVQFQASVAAAQAAAMEAQQWQQAIQADQVKKLNDFRNEQNQKLAESLGLDTDDKAKAFEAEITEFANTLGITPHRISQYTADEILLMRDAMRYRKAVSKKAELARKTTPPPPVIRPGAPASQQNSREQRVEQLSKQLKKTGDDRVAAELIKAKFAPKRK